MPPSPPTRNVFKDIGKHKTQFGSIVFLPYTDYPDIKWALFTKFFMKYLLIYYRYNLMRKK